MRTVVRSTLIAGLTGTFMVSAAWAGIGISPLPVPSSSTAGQVAGTAGSAVTRAAGDDTTTAKAASPADLGAGQLLVGAAKTPMTPRPEDMKKQGFPNARWETDPAKCTKMDESVLSDLQDTAGYAPDGIVSAGSPWPENPDCIYMGGFGIGPANPVKAFDTEYGLPCVASQLLVTGVVRSAAGIRAGTAKQRGNPHALEPATCAPPSAAR